MKRVWLQALPPARQPVKSEWFDLVEDMKKHPEFWTEIRRSKNSRPAVPTGLRKEAEDSEIEFATRTVNGEFVLYGRYTDFKPGLGEGYAL